jgi:hypothetical protein
MRQRAQAYGDPCEGQVAPRRRLAHVDREGGGDDRDGVSHEERQVLLAGVGKGIDRPARRVDHPQQLQQSGRPTGGRVGDALAVERIGHSTELGVGDGLTGRDADRRRQPGGVFPERTVIGIETELPDGAPLGVEELQGTVDVVGHHPAADR